MQKEDIRVTFISNARKDVAKLGKILRTRTRHNKALRSRRLAERKRQTSRSNIIFARRTRLKELAALLAKETHLEYPSLGKNPGAMLCALEREMTRGNGSGMSMQGFCLAIGQLFVGHNGRRKRQKNTSPARCQGH